MASGHAVLSKDNVLYLGSAVPIETTVGVEAFQMPCRERYSNSLDSSSNVEGIDTSLSIYSSGLLMQYTADPSGNVTWFPVQSLHACAAVKATSGALGVRFVALDSQEGLASPHAPLFCAIMRRTHGIKVLECHVFMCKSADSALTMVQAMTYAFEHTEGWMPDDAMPPIVSLAALSGSGPGGPRIVPANPAGLRQKFSISGGTGAQPQLAIQPAIQPGFQPTFQSGFQPTFQPGFQPGFQPVLAPDYENNQNNGGPAIMFIPESPFTPQKKCKKKKKKVVESDDDDDDDDEEEEEIYICKRPDRYRQVPDDLVLYAPQRPDEYYPQEDPLSGYSYYGGPADGNLTAEIAAAVAEEDYLNAVDDYNAAVAAGVDPRLDLVYPGSYAAAAAGYGDLVDGLGYYP